MTRPEAEAKARAAAELAFRLGYRGHAYFVVSNTDGSDFEVRRHRPSEDSDWRVVRVCVKEHQSRPLDPASLTLLHNPPSPCDGD